MLIENLSFPMDRRMRQEALALRDAGYDVSVICPKGENQDRRSFEVVDGIRVYRYPLLVQASGGLGYLFEYSSALLLTFVLMLGIALTRGFDIVHAANPPDLFFLLYLPFGWFGKKFVYDQHDLCPELYETKFHRKNKLYRALTFLEKQSYARASLVIATNQSYYDITESRGRVPAEKLAIVRSGPDLRAFRRTAPRPELKRGFNYMAVYLGVMGVQDGVDRVIRAAHYMVKVRGRHDVLFALVGKGECWDDLRQLTRDLGVDGNVIFTGRIPDEALLQYLCTADVCLAPDPPSPLNNLSTMNKVLEYMACAKPIVSFDLLESRRSAGPAAVYVAEDDASLFAEAIEALLDDPLRRQTMGAAGFQRLNHGLDWGCSAANLVEAYNSLTAPDAQSVRARVPRAA
jgi:glycosyltransferase involved in cell wall biosynthesis